MSDGVLLLATRSADKLREIRQILGEDTGIRLVGLRDVGIEEEPDEENLEHFATFEENALAKARHFAERSGLLTIGDDSGLCVDALGGAPGVRSKRYSNRPDLHGAELDQSNNALLLSELAGVPAARRVARYVCAVALVHPAGDEEVFRGECEGFILAEPRGGGGFGYDPLFFMPGENATFGELSPERKNELSHRFRAVRRASSAIERALDRERRCA
jgi:XTP/dITP diphosphohydrolase